MRTSLFVSTLIAVSLVGSAALADKAKGPGEKLRMRGEMHEKFQRVDRVKPQAHSSARSDRSSMLKSPADTRRSCSESQADCSASRSTAARNDARGKLGALQASVKKGPPNPLESKIGGMKMACNEGEECSLSRAGAKAIWSKARVSGGATGAATTTGGFDDRKLNQVASARMGGDGEPYMSSKEAQKIWRTEAFKAGTVDPNAKGIEWSSWIPKDFDKNEDKNKK
jgi:hypothetical protein